MHLEAPLSCPRCAEQYDMPTRCTDCELSLVDARGREVPVAPRAMSPRVADGAALVAAVGYMLVSTAPYVLARALAMPALAMLAFVPMGLAALAARRAGRNEAPEPADRLDARSREALRESARPGSIREAIDRGGGERVVIEGELLLVPPAERPLRGLPPRFAVTDGTGVALVDDDSLLLWAGDEAGAPRVRIDELPANAHLRVVGRARPARATDGPLAWQGAASGYRDVATVLTFDGDARHRTVAFCRGS